MGGDALTGGVFIDEAVVWGLVRGSRKEGSCRLLLLIDEEGEYT